MLARTLSAEQESAIATIVRAPEQNYFLESVAGSGKTTTLIELCARLSAGRSPGLIGYLAFNRAVGDEVGQKLKARGMGNVWAGTFHALGRRSMRRVFPNQTVDAELKASMMKDRIQFLPKPAHGEVLRLLSLAKQFAVDPQAEKFGAQIEFLINRFDIDIDLLTADNDLLVNLIKNLLEYSLVLSPSIIDFDDMLYVPLLREVPLGTFRYVLVDEAQDSNPARIEIVKRLRAANTPGGCVFVGDPGQAIYGFAGADADSIARIMREFDCARLLLSVSFRCSHASIAVARRYVPTIEPSPDAATGAASYLSWEKFESDAQTFPSPGSALLCRNNAPLIAVHELLSSRGIPVTIAGRDFASTLLRFIGQLEPKVRKRQTADENEISTLIELAHDATKQQIAVCVASDRNQRAAFVADRMEALARIASRARSISALKAVINILYRAPATDSENLVTLSTIHKAKGREWRHVWILGFDELIPSRYAKAEWEFVQERNLAYVAVTRTRGDLHFVGMPDSDPRP